MDDYELETECLTSDEGTGVHLLHKDCQTSGHIVGYISDDGYTSNAGAVVCCGSHPIILAKSAKETGSKSIDFCSRHGSAEPEAGFHILGGTRAHVGEFPHMAALGYERSGGFEFKCGGALVSEKFVISAAHCLASNRMKPSIVRLGRTSLDLSENDDYSAVYDSKIQVNFTLGNAYFQVEALLQRIILAPEYHPRRKYHDIALIELENQVEFGDFLKPICLFTGNDDFENVEESRIFTIIGFGMISNTFERSSDWLQKATVIEKPLKDCQKMYKRYQLASLPENIINSQICACNGDPDNPTDSCQGRECKCQVKHAEDSFLGDSGAPLQITSHSGKYYLVGLTSSGIGCGSTFPAIYTRISSYIDWIESIVWP